MAFGTLPCRGREDKQAVCLRKLDTHLKFKRRVTSIVNISCDSQNESYASVFSLDLI